LEGQQPYPAHDSPFNQPSDESTLTWGDTEAITVHPNEVSQDTIQLIHVMRRRPTTYTIAVQLTLGAGWIGQPAGDLILTITNFIGIGQAKCNLVRVFTVLAADVTNNLSAVNEVYQLPATALQCKATLVPVNALTSPADATLTLLAAPVFS
jgi:hypothetical protein